MTQKADKTEALFSWDGQTLKELFEAGTAWLERNVQFINDLNVYPVPDGDTGTNMLHTMRACLAEIRNVTENAVGVVAERAAYGALMGARGNSGVILSQIWRGFARALDRKQILTAPDLATAFAEAAATAYKGVIQPVEGTILTVIKEVAGAAGRAVEKTRDLRAILEQVVEAAREAVARTPDLLPVLKEAGVVDAGGQGLLVILEGFLKHLRGETVEKTAVATIPSEVATEALEGEYGYDVQFLLRGRNLNVDEIRKAISAMGDSVLVVGDSELVKVHLHTDQPGTPLNYAVSIGSITDVVVENLQEQYRQYVGRREPTAEFPAPPLEKSIGLVAVVPGKGFEEIFRRLMTDAVVYGGQTMNPSTQELLEAINGVDYEQVIVLPNNSNVILAAEQAAKLSGKEVRVVPAETIPQGICALTAFNPEVSLDENVEAMTEALTEVRTGEITTAVRSTKVNGVEVEKGDVIGLLDGKLAYVGNSPEEVALALLQKMLETGEYELFTIYYGADVDEERAERLADQVRERYPDLEVEVYQGGQPHYHYIVSLE